MIAALMLLTALVAEAPPDRIAVVPADRMLTVDSTQSRLRYWFDYSLHDIAGESTAIEGKLLVRGDGKVQLMVRSAVASFKSGDANRDVHMQEVVEAAAKPFVVFKAATQIDPALLTTPGTTTTLKVKGELDFHGERRPEMVSVKIEVLSASELRVTGSFTVSLEAYKIERPSLMFVKLNDECLMSLDLKLKEQTR